MTDVNENEEAPVEAPAEEPDVATESDTTGHNDVTYTNIEIK